MYGILYGGILFSCLLPFVAQTDPLPVVFPCRSFPFPLLFSCPRAIFCVNICDLSLFLSLRKPLFLSLKHHLFKKSPLHAPLYPIIKRACFLSVSNDFFPMSKEVLMRQTIFHISARLCSKTRRLLRRLSVSKGKRTEKTYKNLKTR